VGLYDLEVVSLWGHYFQTGRLIYDNLRTWKADWNDLQLQLMYYISTSCMNHIFSDQNLGTWRVENYQKIVRCIIANTGREVLVLVDFQDDYYSINY